MKSCPGWHEIIDGLQVNTPQIVSFSSWQLGSHIW
jgi:hypothetical protein